MNGILSSEWVLKRRDWQLEPGWLVEERGGETVLQGAGRCRAALATEASVAYASFSCRIKLVCGGVDIHFPAGAAGTYAIGLREQRIALDKISAAGEGVPLARTPLSQDFAKWRDLAINSQEGRLQIQLDGATVIDNFDPEAIMEGGLAFMTHEDSLAYVARPALAAATSQTVDFDFGPLPALAEAGRAWVIGGTALELRAAAEAARRRALDRAGENQPEAARELAGEAERFFRESLISGLRTGLIQRYRNKLEDGSLELETEALDRLHQNLEAASAFLEEAQAGDMPAEIFLERLELISFGFISGTASPDLRVRLHEIPVVQEKGIVPFPPLSDRPTAFYVVVENIGTAPVDRSFDTELHIDGRLVKTWRFPSAAERQDLAPGGKVQLKPGDSRVYSFEQTFPQGGRHRLTWIVDPQNEVLESDKTNNKLDLDLLWQGPPNLTVKDIQPVGAAMGGQESLWNITIANEGAGDAKGPFLTSFEPQVPGAATDHFWTQSLAAGKSLTFTSKQRFRAWGKRILRATVDMGNRVAEGAPTGEGDNTLVKTFNLAPVDLEVKDLKVTQGLEATSFSFTVANNGPGDATLPFQTRIWPGRVKEGTDPLNYLVQPILKTVDPLKAGQSVVVKHSVALPAGDYPFSIEADYPDPEPVYFEPHRNNNLLVKTVRIEEKHFVRVMEIKYGLPCHQNFWARLDRRGSYWKGDVVLKLMHQNNVVDEATLAWKDDKAYLRGERLDRYPDKKWQANAELAVFAKVAGKLIPAAIPSHKLWLHFHPRPVLQSITPAMAKPGDKAIVTIRGKNLLGPQNKASVNVGFPHYEGISGDSKTKVSLLSLANDAIQAEFDIAGDARLGKRVVWVTHCSSSVYWPLSFDVVSSTAPPKPQPTPKIEKKPDLAMLEVWTEPSLPSPGEAFVFYFSGVNLGGVASKASKIKVNLSGDAKQSATIKLGAVKPGHYFKGWWKFPSGLAKGNYHFDVHLNYDGKLKELRTANNWGSLGKVIL